MRVSSGFSATRFRADSPRPERAVFALFFVAALPCAAVAQTPPVCPTGLAAGLLPEQAVAVSSEPVEAQTEERPIVIASQTVSCDSSETDLACETRARALMATAAAEAGAGATILANVLRLPAAIAATFDRNGTIESLRFDDTESVFAYISQITSDPTQSIVVQSIEAEGSGARVVDVSAVMWQAAALTPPGLRVRFRDIVHTTEEVEDLVDDAAMIWGVDLVGLERVAGGAGQYVVEVSCP
jgi:hypothetical protein